MKRKLNLYECCDCGNVAEFGGDRAARASGWAIARDRKTCYCPSCAPARRHVGKYGGKRMITSG